MENTENKDQRVWTLKLWLDAVDLLYMHLPDLASTFGDRTGMPNYLIFDPPTLLSAVGVAIKIETQGVVNISDLEAEWLDNLHQRGWLSLVATDDTHAIEQLISLGFGI